MTGQDGSSASAPFSGDANGRWGIISRATDDVLCGHDTTKIDRTHHGSFLVLSTVCTRCGKILAEEKVLALERTRCPVDPRLDRCLMSCPVEEGSLVVFENPCEPVKKLMLTVGVVPQARPARRRK